MLAVEVEENFLIGTDLMHVNMIKTGVLEFLNFVEVLLWVVTAYH